MVLLKHKASPLSVSSTGRNNVDYHRREHAVRGPERRPLRTRWPRAGRRLGGSSGLVGVRPNWLSGRREREKQRASLAAEEGRWDDGAVGEGRGAVRAGVGRGRIAPLRASRGRHYFSAHEIVEGFFLNWVDTLSIRRTSFVLRFSQFLSLRSGAVPLGRILKIINIQ